MYFASYKFLSLIYLIILYHPCSLFIVMFIVVLQSLGPVQLFKTTWTSASQASLSFTISQRLFKLMSIESVMTCKHLALCRSLLLLPSIFPSIGVFSSESVLHISITQGLVASGKWLWLKDVLIAYLLACKNVEISGGPCVKPRNWSLTAVLIPT